MQISKINLFSDTNFKQRDKSERNISARRNENNEIANNTLSEAMGRSMVRPKGADSPYNITRKFSCVRSGRADYNSATGDLAVTTRGFIPVIKRKELYYPKKETQVLIRRTPEGIKKVTHAPHATVTQIFDKATIFKAQKDFSKLDKGPLDYKNGEIYRLVETDMGSKYLTRYDKALNRRIHLQENAGGRYVRILDTKTGKLITSGERILDEYYDKENDEYVTENLLTGMVTKRVQYINNSEHVKYEIDYHKNSEVPEYIYNYSASTGLGTEKFIDLNGKVWKLHVINKQDRSKEIYLYDTSTGEIVEHREEFYGLFSKGKPLYEIIYDPQSADIDKTIEYKKDYKATTQYSRTEETGENKPITIEYTEGKNIFKFVNLQEDGETPQSEIRFNAIGEASCTGYDEKGNVKFIDYFNKNNKLTTSVEFANNSKSLASVTKYSPRNKGYRQYIYSDLSKYPINIINVDESNNIKKLTLNLDSKNNPKTLSSTYFEKGKFDFEWLVRRNNDLRFEIEDKDEVMSKMFELGKIGKAAFEARQSNFRRIG